MAVNSVDDQTRLPGDPDETDYVNSAGDLRPVEDLESEGAGAEEDPSGH